jgi:ATP-dependent DNA helicase PIF1
MRVHLLGDETAGQFTQTLLTLGNGKTPVDSETGLIDLPASLCQLSQTESELRNRVFPNIVQQYKNHGWLCERAILAPRNDIVNVINNNIQALIPGGKQVYQSIDTMVEEDESVNYPTEFLNSLEPPGMPPHKLTLKIGTPVILLRNLDAPRLCNGTRLAIKQLRNHVIEATILTGCAKGEDVFIPRIPLQPTDVPFEWKRLQFPVRVAFAMTINKAQGQSLKVVGINLEGSCFSHGQLYVACSRVGTSNNLHIYAPDPPGKTANIVYQKAIT